MASEIDLESLAARVAARLSTEDLAESGATEVQRRL